MQTLRAVYDGISGVALNVETYSKRHEIPSRDQPISVVTFVFISIVIFLTGFVSEKLNGMGVVKFSITWTFSIVRKFEMLLEF